MFFAAFAAVFVTLSAGTFSGEVAGFNECLERSWEKHRVTPGAVIDDAAFFRRLSFRVLGRLPKVDELKSFISDRDPEKRAKLPYYQCALAQVQEMRKEYDRTECT